jgi:hypothetical protein
MKAASGSSGMVEDFAFKRLTHGSFFESPSHITKFT